MRDAPNLPNSIPWRSVVAAIVVVVVVAVLSRVVWLVL
jgi:hypothetical protein